jgi:HEAT repeat protein
MLSTSLQSMIPAVPAQAWRFDVRSALIGAAVALVLTLLLYVYRAALRAVWDALGAWLGRVRHRLEASAADIYCERVVAHARRLITGSHLAPLDALFVEPWLVPPLESPDAIPEAGEPLTRPEPLPLHAVFGGHHLLALLGGVGSGRTALLGYVALVCAGSGDFETGGMRTLAGIETLRERLPLFVDLTVLDWGAVQQAESPDGSGPERQGPQPSDASEWLLSSAVATVGGKSRLLAAARRAFAAGRAVVLVDGWDELPAVARTAATARLGEAIGAAPGNIWLTAAGERGYAPLIELGFVPLRMATWSPAQVDVLAERWAQAVAGDEQLEVTTRLLQVLLRRAARWGARPMELGLRAFAYLSERQDLPRQSGALFERAADRLLWQPESPWVLATCRIALGRLAMQSLREERAVLDRDEIDAAIEVALPPSDDGPARAAVVALRALTGERGLLRAVQGGRYTFVHPLWQAYFAARQAVAASYDLVEQLELPGWAAVFDFYAEFGDMGPLVAGWLRAPDDLSHHRLRTLARWIRVAPDGAAWREKAMAILARALLKPQLPRQVRVALAEDLALTGMPGVPYFLGQMLESPDVDLRLAAVTALGRMAGEAELSLLEKAMVDADPQVCRACLISLTELDLDAATRLLADWLTSAEQDALRPEIAEALAACGEQGHALLREAADLDNVQVRRAAVFGLAAAGDLDTLERVARGDEQWIVRSAAAAVLSEQEVVDQPESGVPPLPEVDQLPWLISWAAGLGEGVGRGDAARAVLVRALREGEAPVRLAALATLTLLGGPGDVEDIRPILASADPLLSDAALDVLAEISRRYDLVIAA